MKYLTTVFCSGAYICRMGLSFLDLVNTKHKPCDFLQGDSTCRLGDCKPDSCKKYPYIDQPERLFSLFSVLDTIEVCPVAFEIYERLKKEYRFRKR